MSVIGIIAEYNPFHSGHLRHIFESRCLVSPDSPVVCVMSGNWVQRASAALTDKWTRAALALHNGADLILELPTVWAISSAEAFAGGGVSLLHGTGVTDVLSFGSEAGQMEPLQETAECLASDAFRGLLRTALDHGISFAAARQAAAEQCIGSTAQCLRDPNNNLGVEYLRALNLLNSRMTPVTILRAGSPHDALQEQPLYASAFSLRSRLLNGDWNAALPYLPSESRPVMVQAGFYSLSYAERAVFARLRTMDREDFLRLPDCGEGLADRLSDASRSCRTLEDLYQSVKSKRYAHSRVRRLVLWAYLGLTAQDRPASPPYLRVLGMTRRGREVLHEMKRRSSLPILTKPAHAKELDETGRRLFELEARCTALYELCKADFPSPGKNEYTTNPVIL